MCLRCIFLCSPVFARCYASATFAVMRCLSVCPSACFCLSRSWILSKPINISSLFSPSGSHTVLVFFSHVKRYSNIPTGTPFRGGGGSNAGWICTNCDSRWISGCRSMNWWSANNCDRPPCSLPHRRYASVSLCVSQPAWTTTMKRREENLFVSSGDSEEKVTNIGRLHSTYSIIERD